MNLQPRVLLFVSVAGVLAIAAERPAHGSTRIETGELLTHVPQRPRAEGLELAQAYVEAARREGDARYLGLAEGVLNALPPSREARLLRATILQSRHEFPAALRELDALLAEAEDAQARLTQATVLTVIGAYERAREACAKLPPSVYAVACAASIDALTGEHERARRSLERALRAGVELPWLHSLLGEQAYWQGDDARAERELSEDQDRYSRALLADLALDRGAPIEGDELHLALAELARAEPGEAVARMEASIADSEARGDRVHKREEARFWLARGRAERALACARENWAVQHEPWDARVLLEAARTREDAAPALAWLAQTRFASPRLHALAERFSEAP